MQFVTGYDKRQRANGNLIFVGGAAALPRFPAERPQQGNRGIADVGKFFSEVCESAILEITGPHIIILLEARERDCLPSRNAKGPVAENTLAIVHVPEHFLNGPLAGRVTKIAVALGMAGKKLHHQKPLSL